MEKARRKKVFWNRWLIRALAILLLGLYSYTPAQAAPYYWINPGAGDWSISGNWDQGSVPTSGDNAYISNDGTAEITAASQALSLFLGVSSDGGHVSMTGGSLSVSSNGYIGFAGTGSNTFTQTGGTSEVVSVLRLGYGSDSSGSYNLSGTGSLLANVEQIGFAGTGTFIQSGGTNEVRDLHAGVQSGSSGSYNLGAGSLSVSRDAYIGKEGSGTFTQTGGMNTVARTMTIATGAGAGTYNLSGGTLTAANIVNNDTFSFIGGTLSVGTFTGDLTNSGGTLAPGGSPGLTSIVGAYTQDASGTLLMELGGLVPQTDYDVLAVSGLLTLGGTLETVLYEGFNPQVNDTFDILNWGSISGTFDTVNLPTLSGDLFWDTSELYTTGALTVMIPEIPEPTSLLLLGSGLIGLGMVPRRRKKMKI